jgi:Xaa-Pro aminopeptidase
MGKQRVLEEMARHGVDVLLLGREGNARYVSGAHRLFLAGERAFAPGCVVVRSTGEVHVLSNTDFGIPNAGLYATSWNPATVMERVVAIPGVADAKTIGVDGLTPLFEALLPGAELVDGEAVMRQARRIKSPEDAAGIRASASVAVAVMAVALDAVARGDDHQTVIAMSMEAMAAEGTTTAAFEPRVRRDGERATVAVGVLRDGWEADVTRTVPGPSTPDALAAAIDRCCAGTTVGNLGADVHGIGLGYEVLAPSDVLEPGMVLSIGVDGARDTLLVTDDSPETLTG